MLATSHMFGVHLGWAELAATAPIAENAALAAVRCDHENAWAHAALGSVCFSTRRLADALSEFEQALALNPSFSLAQGYYALALSYAGRPGDSFEAARKAIRLSPRDPSLAIYYGIAGYARFTERQYDEAIALAREAIRHRGDLTGAYRVLAVSAGMTGDSALAEYGAPGTPPHPAQHLAALDRDAIAVGERCGSRALSGGIPAGGVAVMDPSQPPLEAAPSPSCGIVHGRLGS